MKDRTASLESIRDRTFDLCIIGGGATGLGCALDATLRGLSTVLIDADDFVSKTSSASTKLIHGGVRYLQEAVLGFDFGQLQMVRKALHERVHMLHAAPYLARPLELLVPCYSRWQRLYIAVGMKLYDMFAGQACIAPSRLLSARTALDTLPSLRRDKLVGGVAYTDGQFDDARYGVAMAKTIAQRGGELLNYARVVGFGCGSDGKLASARVEDRIGGKQFEISARVFLNCTGPFADTVRLMANSHMNRRLRVSKGTHILLPLDRFRSDVALLIPHTEDGRVIFAIPWFGSLLVGTTEDEVQPRDEVVADESELAYLLKYINKYLVCGFTPADVQAAFSGVRPLVASKGSGNTTRLVRAHEVEVDEASGLISILGGKWTTYRAMAEDGMNHVERRLGKKVNPAVTRGFQLTGSPGFHAEYWKELASQYRLPEPVAVHLAQTFGTDAPLVVKVIQSAAELSQPVYPEAPVLAGEILYCIREEMAQSIEDLLARRTGIQTHSWNNAVAAAPAVGRLLGSELGWSDATIHDAVNTYTSKLRRWADRASISLKAS